MDELNGFKFDCSNGSRSGRYKYKYRPQKALVLYHDLIKLSRYGSMSMVETNERDLWYKMNATGE